MPPPPAGPPPSSGPGGGGGSSSQLKALCNTDGSSSSLHYDFLTDSTFVKITTNGCANRRIDNSGVNSARIQNDLTWYIPKVPRFASIPYTHITSVPGALTVLFSGSYLYGYGNAKGGDAGIEEMVSFDYCGAHSDRLGNYHNHILGIKFEY